jgi:hypothetical protein
MSATIAVSASWGWECERPPANGETLRAVVARYVVVGERNGERSADHSIDGQADSLETTDRD